MTTSTTVLTPTVGREDALALVAAAGFEIHSRGRYVDPAGTVYWQLDEALTIALAVLAEEYAEQQAEPRESGNPPAPFFMVDDLQACEPDALTKQDGISVEITEQSDSMGFPRVAVKGDSREAIIDYVRENWGDDDTEWFADQVCDRIEQVGA